MSESARDFVLIAEDTAAALAAATIVDRVVHERGEEWHRDLWEHNCRAEQRRWRGLSTDGGASSIVGIGEFSKKQNVAPKRKITTLAPGRGGVAVEVAKFFAALDEADEHATLAVFACDLDKHEPTAALAEHEERVLRLKKYGNDRVKCFAVALAKPEFEAWIIAGFSPANDHEKERLATQQAACKFDPCETPHDLHSNTSGPRDAKTVLSGLCQTRSVADERARICIERTSLERLETRGGLAGVRGFIEQITRDLLPVL